MTLNTLKCNRLISLLERVKLCAASFKWILAGLYYAPLWQTSGLALRCC